MSGNKLASRLQEFRDEKSIRSKGALSVVLHLSRYAKKNGLPLKVENLTTSGKGQVLGLGKDAL